MGTWRKEKQKDTRVPRKGRVITHPLNIALTKTSIIPAPAKTSTAQALIRTSTEISTVQARQSTSLQALNIIPLVLATHISQVQVLKTRTDIQAHPKTNTEMGTQALSTKMEVLLRLAKTSTAAQTSTRALQISITVHQINTSPALAQASTPLQSTVIKISTETKTSTVIKTRKDMTSTVVLQASTEMKAAQSTRKAPAQKNIPARKKTLTKKKIDRKKKRDRRKRRDRKKRKDKRKKKDRRQKWRRR